MSSALSGLSNIQKWLVIAIAALILYAVSAGASYSIFSAKMGGSKVSLTDSSAKNAITVVGEEEETGPKTEGCPLNGSMHSQKAKDAWAARRPLAVMIENHTEARPQSGLTSADVVYETVAEGGITRFMALFYCNLGEIQVGPVRSARTYFLDWLSEYDALYAHVGGANTPGPANALGQIETYGIKDLNQFSIGFPTYWRDYERLGHPVATEHTMYSTTTKLWAVGAKRGWTAVDDKGVKWDKNFVAWQFKDDKPNSGTVAKINVPFWTGYNDFVVDWTYDGSCNCYHRKNAGVDHVDFNNKRVLSPKNVVIQYERESHANDGYENNAHLIYGTKGSGKMLLLQDGKVIEGTWSKKDRLSREKFLDKTGKEISFNRGQIWIETVPDYAKVVY